MPPLPPDDTPPPPAAHPGILLAEELAKRGWAQSDLTFILGCNPKAVNQIINGKQGISPAMSKALGKALGLPLDYFAGLQRSFDLSSASDPDDGVGLRADMVKNFPIREMIKRGWIRGGDADLGQQLAQFFEVSAAGDIPHLAHAAKKTSYDDEIPGTQLAWLFRVRKIAKSITAPKYSEVALTAALPRLRDMLVEPEEARNVPRVLAECGVRFIIVESLPQSKIDGVCFWLDKTSPVIAMSMRFDRIDNFWFVLRHEIEHILKEHGRGSAQGMIDVDIGLSQDNIPEEERVANAAAADFCVPREKMESFFHRKNPFFYEKDVVAFAKINGIHPGLAVGQIQHRTDRYDYLKKYQTKIRQFVTPSAIVDGWDRPLDLN
ncbi:MAG TPA: ImmA/IrrE family metallo-endopeptidase [Rhizomicrobium sp.]|nr:ImmA/IrrE family metallo-endopeptidase [Rhizomicrobium sp.]